MRSKLRTLIYDHKGEKYEKNFEFRSAGVDPLPTEVYTLRFVHCAIVLLINFQKIYAFKDFEVILI